MPTSPERRVCETRRHQSTYYHLVRYPTAIQASSSNSARSRSSRQPGNLGSKATAQAALGDSCLQPPAGSCKSDQRSCYRGHSSVKSGATGPQHTPWPLK